MQDAVRYHSCTNFLRQPRVNRSHRDTRSYVCPGLSLDLIAKVNTGGCLFA